MTFIDEFKAKLSALNIYFHINLDTGKGSYPIHFHIETPSGSAFGIRAGIMNGTFHFLPNHTVIKETNDKEYITYLLEFIDIFCLNNQIDVSFCQDAKPFDDWGKNTTSNLFASFSYKNIDRDLARVLNNHKVLARINSGFIKSRNTNSINVTDFKEVWDELSSELTCLSKKEPVLYLYETLNLRKFDFYYEGVTSSIKLSIKENSVFLKQDDTYEIKTMGDVKFYVEKIFSSLKKKNKIKNIFNPPDFHFRRLMDELGLLYFNDLTEKIQNELFSYYSPNDLEEVCACVLQNGEFLSMIEFHIYLFSIGNRIFIYDENNNNLHHQWSIHEYNDAFSTYKTLIVEQLDKKLANNKEIFLENL